MRIRLICLTVALVLVALSATAQEVPWTVFTDEAAARTATDFESPVSEMLASGSQVSGEIVTAESGSQWLAIGEGAETRFVSLNSLTRVHPNNMAEGDLPIGSEVVDRWWGLPLDYEPSDLEDLPSRICSQEDRTYRLRAEAHEALEEMLNAARGDDVDIKVFSSFRSATYQRRLFDRAVERQGSDQRGVARPGHSEHQLGTCVDLCDPAGLHAARASFAGTPQYGWLTENAERFGFRQTYTESNVDQTGYQPESWHWRYVGRESLAAE